MQGRDFLVAVSAYPESGEPLDLTDRVVKGKLAWDVPAGKWRLFVVKAVWCGPMADRRFQRRRCRSSIS